MTMLQETQSGFKGSVINMANTKYAIELKYGKEEAERYDPRGNCFTERKWKLAGYKIKKDENALITVPTVKTFYRRDEVTGENQPSGRRPANAKLYYILQVEPV